MFPPNFMKITVVLSKVSDLFLSTPYIFADIFTFLVIRQLKKKERKKENKSNLYDWFLKTLLYTTLFAARKEVIAKMFSCIQLMFFPGTSSKFRVFHFGFCFYDPWPFSYCLNFPTESSHTVVEWCSMVTPTASM